MVLGISFFVVFVAAWAFATLGGFVSRTFLADPITMLQDGWTLLTRFGFAYDIGMTIWRVVGGFVLVPAMIRLASKDLARDIIDRTYEVARPAPAAPRPQPERQRESDLSMEL